MNPQQEIRSFFASGFRFGVWLATISVAVLLVRGGLW
jgi:hypothetical protein